MAAPWHECAPASRRPCFTRHPGPSMCVQLGAGDSEPRLAMPPAGHVAFCDARKRLLVLAHHPAADRVSAPRCSKPVVHICAHSSSSQPMRTHGSRELRVSTSDWKCDAPLNVSVWPANHSRGPTRERLTGGHRRTPYCCWLNKHCWVQWASLCAASWRPLLTTTSPRQQLRIGPSAFYCVLDSCSAVGERALTLAPTQYSPLR